MTPPILEYLGTGKPVRPMDVIQAKARKMGFGIKPRAVDPALRKCHSETCWDCNGTGINCGGFICSTNNEPPF